MKISATDVQNIISELVEEMSNEGVGYVYAKDRAKDPKSIPGEHWRIKFGSEKDIKKHGDSEDSPVNENRISKRELKEIIRELVSEAFPSKLNEIFDSHPINRNKDEIARLIFGLRQGEYIWFSFDKEGRSGGGYGVQKTVEGDEYVYKTTGQHGEYLESEEDIQHFAEEVAKDKYVNFYAILNIQGYVKQHPEQDDDQALGSYELNGPDRPEPQFEGKSRLKEYKLIDNTSDDVTPEMIEQMRDWIKDCQWKDIGDESDVDALTPQEVIAGVEHHYDGGVKEFIRNGTPSENVNVAPDNWGERQELQAMLRIQAYSHWGVKNAQKHPNEIVQLFQRIVKEIDGLVSAHKKGKEVPDNAK